MSRTWLLSGVPRSGTSLACWLAGELPDTTAIVTPFNARSFKGKPGDVRSACAHIGEFVEQTRERLLTEGRTSSVQVEGRLYQNIVESTPADGGLRQPRGKLGELVVDKPLSARFALVIKDNGVFAALLPELNETFSSLALVRNPLSVLASWQTVNLPVHRGRVPGAEQFDQELRISLEKEADVLRRQLVVLDWFFGRFRAHVPPGNIVRYEHLIESGGRALFRRLGHPGARHVDLKSRNASPLYHASTVDTLLRTLLERGGDWTHFYSPADCELAANRIRRGR